MYIGYITVKQSSRIVVFILSVISHQLALCLSTCVNCVLHEVVATYTNTKVYCLKYVQLSRCVVRILSVSILASSCVTLSQWHIQFAAKLVCLQHKPLQLYCKGQLQ